MKALVLVDIQNDFVTGGALAVPGGEKVVPIANRVMSVFSLVVASQDWHPPDHGSFASRHPGHSVGDRVELDGLEQILWPDHCVQQTHGAEFVAELDTARVDRVFRKGTDPRIDSYSAYYDNGHRNSTGLDDFLRQQGVTDVYHLGLATDYCVKFSALDARQLGFRSYLIEDGCRGVDLELGDVERALEQMHAAGVEIKSSASLTSPSAG